MIAEGKAGEMRRIFFAYDVGPQSRLEWVSSAFKENHIDVRWIAMRLNEKNRIYRWRKILHFCCYLETALKTIRQSDRGDVIVCWNFIIGAFAGALCRLSGKDRVILSLNMISHRKGGLVARLRRKVYNYTFAYPSFLFTVNSADTLSHYRTEYRFDAGRVFVLPDPYLPTYKEQPFDPSGGYVFCGGEAQRDWMTYWKAAERLPQYPFVGVGRRKYMPKDVSIPANVTMYYDITESEFNRLLEKSAWVALPLLSHMPAGLIVMYKAIFLSKPLIITRTSSVENYLEDGRSAVLLPVGDAEGLAGAIGKMAADETWAGNLTRQAREAIRSHSPESYSRRIYTIIEEKILHS
jgi:glycosyltransferase involved in cell wall biosynthesis